jgi:hypothetical protein
MFVAGTGLKFHFMTSQAMFDAKAIAGELVDGHLYFVGNLIYLALTASTYQVFGGMSTGTPPTDPDEGIFYYDPTTGVLKIFIDGKWVILTNAIASIVPGTGVDEGSFVITTVTGETTVLSLPKTTGINEANATDALLPTEKAVVDYITAKLGAFAGGVIFRGAIDGSVAGGVASLSPAPLTGSLYKVSADGTFDGEDIALGDWVIFSSPTTYHIFKGVELAAVDNLVSTDTLSPLAANQGRVLDGKITDLDKAKMDKIDSATGGKIALTLAAGNVEESDLAVVTSIDLAGGASNDGIPTELAVVTVVDVLDAKIDGKMSLLPAGSVGGIVTAVGDGEVQVGLTVSGATMNTNPAIASLTTIPTEKAVAQALADVAASAEIEWIVD